MNEEDKFIMDRMFDKVMEHCEEDLAGMEYTLEKYTALEQTLMLGYLLSRLLEEAPKNKQKEIKRLIEDVIING